jgi:hypothetical protein
MVHHADVDSAPLICLIQQRTWADERCSPRSVFPGPTGTRCVAAAKIFSPMIWVSDGQDRSSSLLRFNLPRPKAVPSESILDRPGYTERSEWRETR